MDFWIGLTVRVHLDDSGSCEGVITAFDSGGVTLSLPEGHVHWYPLRVISLIELLQPSD